MICILLTKIMLLTQKGAVDGGLFFKNRFPHNLCCFFDIKNSIFLQVWYFWITANYVVLFSYKGFYLVTHIHSHEYVNSAIT